MKDTTNGIRKLFLVVACYLLDGCVHAQVAEMFTASPRVQVIKMYLQVPDLSEAIAPSFQKKWDSIINYANRQRNDTIIWYAKLFKMAAKANTLNEETAMEALLLDSIDDFSECPYTYVTATYHCVLARFYYMHNKFEKAFQQLVVANFYLEKAGYGNYPLTYAFASDHFGYYYQFEDYETALKYALIAAKYPEPAFLNPLFNLNNVGVTYVKLNDIANAKITFNKVMKEAQANRDTVWMGIASGNYGNMLRLQQQYTLAIPYLLNSVTWNTKREPADAAISCIYLANCHMQLGNFNKANEYLAKGKYLQVGWNASAFHKHYYENMARYGQLTGNANLAALYYDSLFRLTDSLKNVFSSHVTFNTKVKFNEATFKAEKDKMALEVAANKMVRNIVIASLCILFFLVVYVLRKKQQHNEVLLLQKQKEAELLLATAKNELNLYIKSLKEKNALIEAIENKMAGLEHSSRVFSEMADEPMQQLLNSVLVTEDDWAVFKQLYNEVYPRFFDEVTTRFPDLSQSEIRLLSLSKLGLTNKHIARMLGISLASLRKSRYRLRKKYPQLSGTTDFGPDDE